MNDIKVSVIIPVYNAQEYLEQCLNSVLNQSLGDIEVICVDDGSTDESVKILEKYISQDNRVKLLLQKNSGSGPARNRGILTARGQYVVFMDSDDLYPEQNTLEKLFNAAEEKECKIAGGYKLVLNGTRISNEKDDKIRSIIEKNPKGCFIEYCNLQTDFNYYCYIFEREMLIQSNISFPAYRRFQDPPFFVKAMIVAKKVYLIPYPTYLYRWGHKTISWDCVKTTDLLRGHIEVLQLAREYNLQSLYNDVVQRLDIKFKDSIIFETFKNYSLGNLDLYVWLVHLSTIEEPKKNTASPVLRRMLSRAEWYFSQLISIHYIYGCDWLCSFLTNAKEKYLDINPNGEEIITYSILRVLSKIFAPDCPYQARVMLREFIESQKYYDLGLQIPIDELKETIVFDRVKSSFRFVEELKQGANGADCHIVHDCFVEKPKFSVIIPVYNIAPYIKSCLESVVNQTLSGIEIICVEDGSNDESFAILMEYAKRYSNIKVLKQSNAGLSVARNEGLEVATGEFIHFLDGDDFVKPEIYETLYKEMTAKNLDILYFNAETFYENENLERQYPGHKSSYYYESEEGKIQKGTEYYIEVVLSKKFTPVVWMYGIRRSLLVNNKLKFLERIVHEDNFFTNACILLARRISRINQVFYCYRIREGSLTVVSKDFRHPYGFFANYLAFERFLFEREFTLDVRGAAAVRLSAMLNNGYIAYKNIQDENQRYYYLALPPEESELFGQLFYNRYMQDRHITDLNKKLSAQDRGVKDLNKKLSVQDRHIKDLNEKLSAQDRHIKDLNKKLRASVVQAKSLKTSVSFKLGRTITWLPRKIRGGLRCYKQHGMVYTLKRIYWHIFN